MELERRRKDGTRKMQMNKYPHFTPGGAEKKKEGDETESTDSGFGRDPRFVGRMLVGPWICGAQQGGR